MEHQLLHLMEWRLCLMNHRLAIEAGLIE